MLVLPSSLAVPRFKPSSMLRDWSDWKRMGRKRMTLLRCKRINCLE